MRAELAVVDGDGETEDEQVRTPWQLEDAAPPSGPTPQRAASNTTAVSRTDRTAKLRHKPGQREHLVHRAQVAVDPERRVIVAVQAQPARAAKAVCCRCWPVAPVSLGIGSTNGRRYRLPR